MFKLAVLCKFDPVAEMPDKAMVLPNEFDTSSHAELRAMRWLMYRPNDIVMLLELGTGICKHCGVGIYEKEGWVVYKWMHNGGYRICLNTAELTRAEPQEE